MVGSAGSKHKGARLRTAWGFDFHGSYPVGEPEQPVWPRVFCTDDIPIPGFHLEAFYRLTGVVVRNI